MGAFSPSPNRAGRLTSPGQMAAAELAHRAKARPGRTLNWPGQAGKPHAKDLLRAPAGRKSLVQAGARYATPTASTGCHQDQQRGAPRARRGRLAGLQDSLPERPQFVLAPVLLNGKDCAIGEMPQPFGSIA